MNVIFRTDASVDIGSGHVTRCLTLANALQKIGGNVRFICKDHDSNLICKIGDAGYEVERLPVKKNDVVDKPLFYSKWLGGTQKGDAENTIRIIHSLDVDLMIVDHYAIDEYWHKKLRPYVKRILVIDDLGNRKHDCDVLLDQNLGSTKAKYHGLVPNGCELLLGLQYALLRPEFAEWRDRSLKRRFNIAKPKNIFISLGGVDPLNITSEVINVFSNIPLLNDSSLNVVVGSQCVHLDSIQKAARNAANEVNVYIDTDKMAELMAKADIAIGAGGVSAWERSLLGLPSIMFVLADNQQVVANALQKIGTTIIIKSTKELPSAIKKLQRLLNTYPKKILQTLDGVGASRVANHFSLERFVVMTPSEELIATNFTKLTKLELLGVLEARNHPDVRAWMFTKNIISRKKHVAFLKELASNNVVRQFHVSQNKEFVGIISFKEIDWENQTASFGVYANLVKKVSLAGDKLMVAADFIIKRMNFRLIRLQVDAKNNKAIALYEKWGFKIVGSENINGLLYLDFEKRYL